MTFYSVHDLQKPYSIYGKQSQYALKDKDGQTVAYLLEPGGLQTANWLLSPDSQFAAKVIQKAVNQVERPAGLTDSQWEYVKAGVRLLVGQVNKVLADEAEA